MESNFSNFNFNIPIHNDDTLAKKSSDHEYSQNKNSAVKNMENEKLSTYDLSRANHPIACICTIVFKIIAVLSYFFLKLICDSDTMTFIIVVLACALDFWTLKNITGRLLVGLRWWSDFKEDGSEVWIFESYDGDIKLNLVDSTFFWTPQILSGVFWGFLLFYHFITLNIYWGILNALALLLVSINLIAFYRCSKEHEKKMQEMQSYVKTQGLKLLSKNIISQLTK